jgi:hypothetical protein
MQQTGGLELGNMPLNGSLFHPRHLANAPNGWIALARLAVVMVRDGDEYHFRHSL